MQLQGRNRTIVTTLKRFIWWHHIHWKQQAKGGGSKRLQIGC